MFRQVQRQPGLGHLEVRWGVLLEVVFLIDDEAEEAVEGHRRLRLPAGDSKRLLTL